MGFGIQPAVRDHLCGLPDAAAHPESVVPLVCAAHQGIPTGARAARRRALNVAREPTLLGDIGGTTARLAVLAGVAVGPIEHLPGAGYRFMIGWIHGFLGRCLDRHLIGPAVLGWAGHVEGWRFVRR